MPLHLPTTVFFACLLAIWILVLTWRVITRRRSGGVVMGDDGDRALAKAIRAQANATEQVPIFLILFGLAEATGAWPWLLWLIGAVFLAGRLAHGAYFGWHGLHWKLRFYGMAATLCAQGAIIVTLAATNL